MTLEQMMNLAPVVPVLVIDDVKDAVPLARALIAGGLPMLEVTLRTSCALECIRCIAGEVENAVVGAGTVLSPKDLQAAQAAGAQFAVSPGYTADLSRSATIPLLPGVATPGEVMAAMEGGHRHLKLFPAEVVGGVGMLKALGGPLPQVQFCPTGGISAANAPDYLALPNVVCVGGSWVAPAKAVKDGEWQRIEALAKTAAALR
jgi:2-dehydro-3-deoxyphosphogluconate aldolase/(4S)-4-hydroxy-2-oxoglutarate aldolase